MDYFLNGILSTNNTVIEQNMLRRQQLFAKLGRSTKVVLCAYSANSATFVRQQQLTTKVLSCFDWLQEVGDFDQPALRRDDLTSLDNYQRNNVKDGYLYLAGSHLLARSAVNRRGQILRVTYYDDAERRLEVDQYDSRGFLSRRQFYDVQQQLIGEHYLNPAGAVCLDIAYAHKQPVMFNLVRRQRIFTQQQELLQYCLQHLLVAADVVISERREYDDLLAPLDCRLRLVRLYNAAYSGDYAVADYFLARKAAQVVNDKAVLLDEFKGSTTQLVPLWQQLLN